MNPGFRRDGVPGSSRGGPTTCGLTSGDDRRVNDGWKLTPWRRRIQLVVATPRSGGLCMVRPRGWAAARAGRPPMRSPGGQRRGQQVSEDEHLHAALAHPGLELVVLVLGALDP